MRNQYRDLLKLYADREYTGKNIALDNVSHSKIRELEILGETAEIGAGEKSPDNPFTLVNSYPTAKIVGKNLLNPNGKFINGYLDNFNVTAENGSQSTIYRTFWVDINFKAGDKITLSSPNGFYVVRFVDNSNNSYVSNCNLPHTWTLANDCSKLQISLRSSDSSEIFPYKDLSDCKIQVEHGGQATTFSLYTEQSISNTFELNSTENVADSYNPLTGEYVQRVGKLVLKGDEYWNRTHVIDDTSHLYINSIQELVKTQAGNTWVPNIICSHYPVTTYNGILYNAAEAVSIAPTGLLSFRVPYLTRADFNTFLAAQYEVGTPVTVFYELAEPITTIINQTDLKANIPDTTISITEANNLGRIRAVLQTKGE